MSLHFLALMPKIEGALLIFNDGTARPPSIELSDADAAALEAMCHDYLAWRAANAAAALRLAVERGYIDRFEAGLPEHDEGDSDE